jgi:hypothetical protein
MEGARLADLDEETRERTFDFVMRSLEHPDRDVRQAAIECLSSLGKHSIYIFLRQETSKLSLGHM